MDAALDVTLTKTWDNKPLAVVLNLPGGGAELSPGQLRALAFALTAAAAECEAQQISRKFVSSRRSYPLKKPDAGR